MGRPIIADESPFHEAFLPEKALCREQHITEIVNSLMPVKHGMPAKNIYIFGASGVGKTTTIRSILRDHFADVSVYVNCWSNRTSHKIMEEVLRKMGFMIHGKESTSELIKRFENSKRKMIICLDEADHLKDNDMLYVFTRNSCPVILISNHSYSPTGMDGRVKSSLHLHEIEFRPYQTDEITDILRDRTRSGFANAVSDEMIVEVANSCGGDARAAIQILKNAAIDAQSNGLDSITINEIRSAAGYAKKYRRSYLLRKLNEHQKTIYNILDQNKAMNSGALFNEYRKLMNETVTDRSYRNYMGRMVELGLVRQTGSVRWKKYEVI